MKEEALKLADAMKGRAEIRRQATNRKSVQEGVNDRLADQLDQASAMICRLVEELDRLNYDLKSLAKRYKALDRTKPLSDEEIDKVASIKMNQILMDLIDSEDWNKGCTKQHLVNFARAIEERHGIE